MTTLSTNAPHLTFGRIQSDAPILFLGGIFSLLLIVPFAMALALDDRLIEGVNIWIKPLKFAVALTVYLLTLAYYARFAPSQHNSSRSIQIFHGVVMFCIIAEFLWIGGAAMFGTTSHYNDTTPLMELIYGFMGLFAVILTAASLVMGIAILRTNAAGIPTAIGASLIATFVATVIIAGTLSQGDNHFVGGTSTNLMPIMGWARDIGDLRVSHFFATHIMHIAPLLALALSAVGLSGRITAFGATAAVTVFTFATFAQALLGQPFLPWLS